MKVVKSIVDDNVILGIIIGLDDFEQGTNFYGSRAEAIQVATFKHDKGKLLRNHRHIKRVREISKTQEVLIVLEGSCEIRVFDIDDKQAFVGVLGRGDLFISYYGGAGYTVLSEDTYMVESKVGPYEVTNDDEDRVLI